MSLLITNIPKGCRLFIVNKDDPKEIIFNNIVEQEVLEFETDREDNGKKVIIRTSASSGKLGYVTETTIRPRLIKVMLDPKIDLLNRRDGI